jgi:predicted Ser/Thr protein kinase
MWRGRRGDSGPFLLASLRHHVANVHRHQQTQRRGGRCVHTTLDDPGVTERCEAALATGAEPELIFDRVWAETILAGAAAELRREYAEAGKQALYDAVRGWLVVEARPGEYASVASRLGMTDGALAVTVHRLRQRFRQIVRSQVAHTVESPGEIEDELRHLLRVWWSGNRARIPVLEETSVTGSEFTCPGCGQPLAASAAIEGFCARCVAESAFGDLLLAPESGATPELENAGWSSGLVRLGPYVLEEELGRGGMGVVYRARHRQLGRAVALKVLRLGPLSSSDEQARFRREASAAAALRHPNVVTVYEVGEADGHAYLAMELVEGPSLAELTRSGPLLPERAARYARAVADALGAAHAAGILHRDLKPANVLVDGEDQPKVADFGLAKSMAAVTDPDQAGLEALGEPRGSSAAAGLTRAGQILGSPGYMPPEQADPGRGVPTFVSDVYSLGALLFHLLTGRPPFAGPTLTATLRQVLNDEPARLGV